LRDTGSHLEFFNGFGGFAEDGKEYEIILEGGQRPPAPWINVIANREFGFTVSEAGAGHTWAFNSRENKITPWSNDPVGDRAGEVLYLEDLQTGKLIPCTPQNRDADSGFRVRHGFGYTVFSQESAGLGQQLSVFTPLEDKVKLWELKLHNTTGQHRELRATYYLEWVLGFDRDRTNPYLVTAYDNREQLLTAENVYGLEYRQYRAGIFSSREVSGYTGNRQEFYSQGAPARLPYKTGALSNQTGVGYDACGAIQVSVKLAPDERRTLIFGLAYEEESQLAALCRKYRDADSALMALEAVKAYWASLLGQVQVRSGKREADILLNGWLLYQTIACRMYARTAFYQNGGAYGFRDQLQDAMALVYARPDMLREQLLLSAGRQFEEGDVQHWWHPPRGLGVRTRITDDLLWLPYVTKTYVDATGDYGVLDEQVPYITGPKLEEGQHSMMFIPETSAKKGSLYEHCKKAIERTTLGARGLPRMGGGDWNDGMDRVGIQGEGESVWLAWFYSAVLAGFLPLAERMGEQAYADSLRARRAALRESIEQHAWDGDWYLRAFYDDGTPLGSSGSEECRIDSISQSWSILSGAGGEERRRRAFESAWEHLVMEEEGVSLLLTPPFDKTEKNPGYIKNYFPGVRENGGQYTHAAIWLAIAATQLGDADRAGRLFDMLNPINHSLTPERAMLYEREPYVMSADLSYRAPVTGRGGWSWYTGSSGWMYQGLLKHLFGLRKEGDSLIISSCLPADWGDYTIRYRHGSAMYHIEVKMLPGEAGAEEARIRLRDDGQEHRITVETGCRRAAK